MVWGSIQTVEEAEAVIERLAVENEQLRQIIVRHDANRELGRCDGLLDPGAGGSGG